MASCYTLTNCENGSIIATDTDLSLYIGQVITISEVPEQCFLVVEGCSPAVPLIPVTFVQSFDNCQACFSPSNPCECPPNTISVTLPDGSRACREDIISFAQGPDPLAGCQRVGIGINNSLAPSFSFGPSPQYSQSGARFYGEVSGLQWPLTFNTSCSINTQSWVDNNSNILPIINTVSNPAWGDGTGGMFGPWTGRVNAGAGIIMGDSPCSGPVNSGLFGHIYCLNVTTPTTYSIGFMGMGIEISINGLVLLTSTNQDIYQYENWTVFQITLPIGLHIIQMAAGLGNTINSCGTLSFNNPPSLPRTPGSIVGMAFEIYDAPISSLINMTNQSQVDAVLVYSTKNKDNILFDYGSDIYNYRCPCSLPPSVCPTSIGNYGLIKPILDNCSINQLNPNANPNVYICHTYNYTSVSTCCYLLTNCLDPNITYVTSTDLSLYVDLGHVIKVSEYQGCFTVSQLVDCPQPLPPSVTVTNTFIDCESCIPKCYLLTDCEGIQPSILTNSDLSTFVGGVVNILGNSGCWNVNLAGGCQGSIPVIVSSVFATCQECFPICYVLSDCENPLNLKITSTNLSAYLGKIIKIEGCPDTCWIVNLSPNCSNSSPIILLDSYNSCSECNYKEPPPPLELRPRMVKPGYTTPGCNPQYTEKVNCAFSKAVYEQMLISRYGITMCCNDPIEKWDIKKQLLDINAIYEPNLCKNTFDLCCPPCAVVAVLEIYNPTIRCEAPSNVIVELTIPPIECNELSDVHVGVSIP